MYIENAKPFERMGRKASDLPEMAGLPLYLNLVARYSAWEWSEGAGADSPQTPLS